MHRQSDQFLWISEALNLNIKRLSRKFHAITSGRNQESAKQVHELIRQIQIKILQKFLPASFLKVSSLRTQFETN